MAVEFSRGPFEGFEYDTPMKLLRTLDTVSQLSDDCESEHDRQMLMLAFDIISRVRLREYA